MVELVGHVGVVITNTFAHRYSDLLTNPRFIVCLHWGPHHHHHNPKHQRPLSQSLQRSHVWMLVQTILTLIRVCRQSHNKLLDLTLLVFTGVNCQNVCPNLCFRDSRAPFPQRLLCLAGSNIVWELLQSSQFAVFWASFTTCIWLSFFGGFLLFLWCIVQFLKNI